VPGSQARQLLAEMAPAVDKNLPVSQLEQLGDPEAWAYLPAAQLAHWATPLAAYLPAAQLTHAADADSPVAARYVPETHRVQDETPVPAWYWPAAQLVQRLDEVAPVEAR